MQFHHHGYVSTDPRIEEASGVGINRSAELPEKVDFLIVGSGPAGMLTAAQMSQFPSLTTVIIERREERLAIGQADGIQARSVETFQAFGFAERIIQEAYQITEMCFWKPNPDDPNQIVRTARTPDDPAGVSEFPHLIVNQARVLDYYAEAAANGPARIKPNYGYEFISLEINEVDDYPVHVKLQQNDGNERIIQARYVLGADGSRSRVRDAIGAKHIGDVSYHAWGVMDVLANTDFPDIRTKCAIQSNHGSILLIPREGGYLFRMYVDLGELAADDAGQIRKTPLSKIIEKANEIIQPYFLDVKDVAWSSVYEVGHRVTDRFDDVPEDETSQRNPRVFIAGDACHTHSAKAGQGMNVSMQDGFNLGWKIGHVLEGRSPASLLATYTSERQVVAQNLIDFDREWSSMMAAKTEELESPTALEEFYLKTFEFPAGFMTQYSPSLITGESTYQNLAKGYPIGKRFKSLEVIRKSDGNTKHLGHFHKADGRWRIYVFADANGTAADSKASVFASWLETNSDSPIVAYRRPEDDVNSLFDVKVIYQENYTKFELTDAPNIFKPQNGPFGLTNLENVFAAQEGNDIFQVREISREGAILIVRPDMYVANILPLTAKTELVAFFRAIFTV